MPPPRAGRRRYVRRSVPEAASALNGGLANRYRGKMGCEWNPIAGTPYVVSLQPARRAAAVRGMSPGDTARRMPSLPPVVPGTRLFRNLTILQELGRIGRGAARSDAAEAGRQEPGSGKAHSTKGPARGRNPWIVRNRDESVRRTSRPAARAASTPRHGTSS